MRRWTWRRLMKAEHILRRIVDAYDASEMSNLAEALAEAREFLGER